MRASRSFLNSSLFLFNVRTTAFIATTTTSRMHSTSTATRNSNINAKISMVFASATPIGTGTTKNNDFTSSRSIPKEETKVLDLLKLNPKFDGRGTKIAILDTGCDLAVAGLQETSDGLPKYLDFLDCTGDGDIDTTAVVTIPEADSNGTVVIKGKSGRNLTLGDWATTDNEVRLGSIRLYDVIPRSVKSRLQRERKAAFVNDHQRLITQVQQKLDQLQSQIDSCTSSSDAEASSSKGDKTDKDNEKEINAGDKKKLILQRTDSEVLLNQYQSLLDDYNDSGPFMDVVLFRDDKGEAGDHKAVIDLKADGNLTKAVSFAPFAKNRDIGTFGHGAAVTFCIQIYDEGKTLSIVTDAGSHGTHVAGISAANFGPHNIKNGVAPGAQILGCKIGDGRLGSAETGTGLIRALIAAKKYDCDLINLSYGEPSWQPDSGRVSEIFADATRKWGMTVFTSAGNDGPALSSLGSPGSLSAPITVGAYVSKDMMIDQYSTLTAPAEEGDELKDTSYYFSSRGPTNDGLLPDLCAPGGAISPIPRHSLQGKAQYHGTSMSSPNACGVAACVLSALKQKLGVDFIAPAELRKGLLNTAVSVDIGDPFAQGQGLVSATAAFEYILKHRGKLAQDLTVDVLLPNRNNARGLYIRDSVELTGPMTFDVKVLPRFQHSSVRTDEEMEELLKFELDLKLTPSESWVKTPERVCLLSAIERNGQTFSVRLDIENLPPGVHYATVEGIDSNDPDRGCLFRLPVTVVKPHTSTHNTLNERESVTVKENGLDLSMNYNLQVGAPSRRFLDVPSIAEYATIKIKSASPSAATTSPHRVLIHAVPFVRGDLPNTQNQMKKLVQMTEGMEKEFYLKVKGGSTLEVCLQLLWLANASSTSVVVDVEFHSYSARSPTLVSSQPVVISAGREFGRFGASANLRSEKLNPTANLDTVHRTIRPKTHDIQSGSADRDIMPPSNSERKANSDLKQSDGIEIYNMFLKYEFEIESDKPIKVTPWIPSLFNQLYDSPIDSQIWELYDSNSQLLQCGSAIHHADAVSIGKGSYSINFHIRHPSRQVLDQVKDVPVELLMSMDALDCKIYAEMDKASTPAVTGDGRKEIGMKVLRTGAFQDLYVARPIEGLPSWVKPGDTLTGKISLDKTKSGVTSMPLLYHVPPKSEVKQLHENKLPKDEEDEKSLEETIFESKVSYLSKLRSRKDIPAYKELSASLLGENSTSISLLSELLLFAKEAKFDSNSTDARLKEIQKVRDLLSVSNGGPIDESALAKYFGVTSPSDDELKEDKDAAKLKKKMDEQKILLQSTLLALSDVMATLASSDSTRLDDLKTVVKELKKWALFTDPKDKLKYNLVLSRHMRLKGNNGAAMKILTDACKDMTDTESFKQLTEDMLVIYKSLDGTEHLIENTKNTLYQRFPPKK